MAVEEYSIGDDVYCDLCGRDYTGSSISGGFMWNKGKAVCPACAPAYRVTAERVGETHLIGPECPAGKSFWRFVVEDVRGGAPGRVTIFTGEDAKLGKP